MFDKNPKKARDVVVDMSLVYTKFCVNCGTKISAAAETCPSCGIGQFSRSGTKNPGLAAILSFFFSGLGQIYNGQIGKGILFIAIQAVNVLLMLVLLGFLTYFIVWVWGIVDAYKTAERINRGSAVGAWRT